MTKTVTSATIMMLYEEGHFHLTDPISKYIPDFSDVKVGVCEQNSDSGQSEMTLVNPEHAVTIQHLLMHMSGLVYPNPDGSAVEVLVGELVEKEDVCCDSAGKLIYFFVRDEPLGDWVKRLAQLPLAHQPGTMVHYGFSVDVLGYLVEVVSGMKLDQFFKQRIFDPLGMIDTDFHVPPEKIERLAGDDGFQVVDGGPSSSWARPKQFLSGGGGSGRGLISTATDYARFAQMLFNSGEFDEERILSRKSGRADGAQSSVSWNRDAIQKRTWAGLRTLDHGGRGSIFWHGDHRQLWLGWRRRAPILGGSNGGDDWDHDSSVLWYTLGRARSVSYTGLSDYR